jgi:hypothetical protein
VSQVIEGFVYATLVLFVAGAGILVGLLLLCG